MTTPNTFDGIETRPMTDEELAAYEAACAAAEQARADAETKAAARESGRAKLLALGLTEDEAKALIP